MRYVGSDDMGTRCRIYVEGIDFAYVYKHWDGYPESTLPWLEAFNSMFAAKRGSDPTYKFAQLLRSSWRDGEEFNLDMSEVTGWGVAGGDWGMGEEWEYRLLEDGSVLVTELNPYAEIEIGDPPDESEDEDEDGD
jgi:hypothetical protein